MPWGLVCALLLASCGQFFPGSRTIVSLAISATSAQIKPGTNQQFTATATYGNNSTGDVTSSVTWTSSSTTIATINSSGQATALAVGSTNITANSGSVVSPIAKLTVSNKTISVITVSPQNITLTVGGGQQYTANATYSDGSNGDITNAVTWTSSSTSVATISSAGFANAVATGTTMSSAAA
ncbi:MAG: Ig-like domain-containing protein [Acidobacteriota bacterium]|nr:Ig-like domain-containing protein [Acidobacteriota bacterium]